MKTLDEMFMVYVKDLKRRQIKTVDKIEQVYKKNISPVLGDKKIDEIVRGDIALILLIERKDVKSVYLL